MSAPALNTDALSPAELRALNKQLAAQGLKVCGTHRGEPLPLTAEHWYRKGDYWQFECKVCMNDRSARNAQQRYRSNPAIAQRIRAQNRAVYWRYRERYLARRRDDYALLPTPPGMAVAVYDAVRQRLRLWDGAGALTASEFCTEADWRTVGGALAEDGYQAVDGFARYAVLARFDWAWEGGAP